MIQAAKWWELVHVRSLFLAERVAVYTAQAIAAEQAARCASGIVHVLKSGARWADAPAVYGPRKMLYNRYVRWG